MHAAVVGGESAHVIDGRAVAGQIRSELAGEVVAFAGEHGRVPALATVLIGDDPASEVYVAAKQQACEEVGMTPFDHRLPVMTSEVEARGLIESLNVDDNVDGIICQLPAPPHIDGPALAQSVSPAKDVDGLTAANAGRLALGAPGLRPCTPLAVMELVRRQGLNVEGLNAVVVGRSNLFGKPMAQLLLLANATVTVAHSKSRDLPEICRKADLLIVGVGRPEIVRRDWVAPGAVVIDVGVNRDTAGLRGDVAFADVSQVASAITPVPGGVGPMTIAMLLRNTIEAARAREGGKGA